MASHEFEVQEYTPNAFEIQLGGPKSFVGALPIELPLSARYLMGKALSKAEVSWSIEAEDRPFKPEGFEKFSFCDAIEDYRLNRLLDRASHFSDQGRLELGEDGRAVIGTTIQFNRKAPQPRSAHLLAEITDLNQQTVFAIDRSHLASLGILSRSRRTAEVIQQGHHSPSRWSPSAPTARQPPSR